MLEHAQTGPSRVGAPPGASTVAKRDMPKVPARRRITCWSVLTSAAQSFAAWRRRRRERTAAAASRSCNDMGDPLLGQRSRGRAEREEGSTAGDEDEDDMVHHARAHAHIAQQSPSLLAASSPRSHSTDAAVPSAGGSRRKSVWSRLFGPKLTDHDIAVQKLEATRALYQQKLDAAERESQEVVTRARLKRGHDVRNLRQLRDTLKRLRRKQRFYAQQVAKAEDGLFRLEQSEAVAAETQDATILANAVRHHSKVATAAGERLADARADVHDSAASLAQARELAEDVQLGIGTATGTEASDDLHPDDEDALRALIEDVEDEQEQRRLEAALHMPAAPMDDVEEPSPAPSPSRHTRQAQAQ